MASGEQSRSGRARARGNSPYATDVLTHNAQVTLSQRTSVFLLLFGIWSWIIWPTFLKNIWQDPRSFTPDGSMAPFLTVHLILTIASLVFGTLIGAIGVRALLAHRRLRA